MTLFKSTRCASPRLSQIVVFSQNRGVFFLQAPDNSCFFGRFGRTPGRTEGPGCGGAGGQRTDRGQTGDFGKRRFASPMDYHGPLEKYCHSWCIFRTCSGSPKRSDGQLGAMRQVQGQLEDSVGEKARSARRGIRPGGILRLWQRAEVSISIVTPIALWSGWKVRKVRMAGLTTGDDGAKEPKTISGAA